MRERMEKLDMLSLPLSLSSKTTIKNSSTFITSTYSNVMDNYASASDPTSTYYASY